MNVRKLLLREKVEVRQFEEGLRGAWYSGVIVNVSELCRQVKYEELLCEGGTSKLIESIPVTEVIEGSFQRQHVLFNHRGRIRPLPPRPQAHNQNSRFTFGVCVDALFEDAWWEGVISDCNDGSEERSVFFPDEGDERKFKVTDIRLTHIWDEFSGNWGVRGEWILMKLAKEHQKDINFDLIKDAWSRLQVNYGFRKMITEWTCGACHLWKKYLMEVVDEITAKTRQGFPSTSQLSASRLRCGITSKRRQKAVDGSTPIQASERKKGKSASMNKKGKSASKVITSSPQGVCDSEAQHMFNPQNSDTCRRNCLAAAPCSLQSELRSSCIPHPSRKRSLNTLARRNRNFVENKLKRRKVKSAVSCKSKLKNIGNGAKAQSKLSDNVSSQLQNHPCFQNRDSLVPRWSIKSDPARGILECSDGQKTLSEALGGPRNLKGNLKIRKTTPKRNREAKAKNKNKVSCQRSQASELRHQENTFTGTFCQEHTPSTEPVRDGVNNVVNNPAKGKSKKAKGGHDSVCFVCQYGGELYPCDRCWSSFHLTCVNLEDVPNGKWLCPCCRCGLCGSEYIADHEQIFTEVCYQCSYRYHVDCLSGAGITCSEGSESKKFCSEKCFEICAHLHKHMQIGNPTSIEGLTWTITRSRRNDYNIYDERAHPLIQPSQVLNVFHECFEPIIEPHTKRDLVADVVYNSGSKLRRLDYHGFYVMVLLSGEDIASVATLRLHGSKVAEIPLVATPFGHRRKGMCRLLVHELEKMLIELGVERLVLPAISQLKETWVSSFGFKELSAHERRVLMGYPFLLFQGTSLFQKVLCSSTLTSTSASLQAPAPIAEVVHDLQGHLTGYDSDCKYGLFYRRKRRKQNGVFVLGHCGHSSPLKHVYKRRRILASRDAVASH